MDFQDADASLDARTRRQVKEYVAGVTRWRRWLDFLLASFYHGTFDEMERQCLAYFVRIIVCVLVKLSADSRYR